MLPPSLTPGAPADRVRLYLLSFLIVGSFGLAAPATHSLLLGHGGPSLLPRAWLAVMVAAGAATAGLRWAQARATVATCFAAAALMLAAVLAGLLAWGPRGGAAWAFCLFVWRDLYIAVLLELMWTQVGHSTLARSPHRHFGWLGAVGTVGGACGGLVNVALARRLGTAQLLWLLVPVLVAVAIGAGSQQRRPRPVPPPRDPAPRPQPRGGWSRGLGPIAAVVLLGHVASTCIDYELAAVLSQALPDIDARTAKVSQAQAVTQACSLLLQASCGWLVARLGRTGALMAAPAVSLTMLLAYLHQGSAATILATKSLSKSFDTSLFRSAKEMLYLPLHPRARTEGKAWVDIGGSRLAKALVSLLLLAGGARMPAGGPIAWAALAAAAGWLYAATRAGRSRA